IGGSPSGCCGAPPYFYSWSPTNGLSDPSAANPIASPASSTTYTLTVTDSNNCAGYATMLLTVNANPVCTVSNATACAGQTACLSVNATAFGGATITNYSWVGGPSGANATNYCFNPVSLTNAGIYTVAVTDSKGC